MNIPQMNAPRLLISSSPVRFSHVVQPGDQVSCVGEWVIGVQRERKGGSGGESGGYHGRCLSNRLCKGEREIM